MELQVPINLEKMSNELRYKYYIVAHKWNSCMVKYNNLDRTQAQSDNLLKNVVVFY
jgi:hypothetical protein